MDSITEVLVDSVFQRAGRSGLDVPRISYRDDLATLIEPITTKQASSVTGNLYDLIMPRDIHSEHESALRCQQEAYISDRKLVEKCRLYNTQDFNAHQMVFADLFRNVMDSVMRQNPRVLAYEGHEKKDWNLFWSQSFWPVSSGVGRTTIMMVDSAVETTDLTKLQPGPDTIYMRRFDVNEPAWLSDLQGISVHFTDCWFASSVHSGFPVPTIFLVGRGFGSRIERTVDSLHMAYLRIHRSVCIRKHRNLLRLEWICMYPHLLRTRFTDQKPYRDWIIESSRFWNAKKQVRKEQQEYAPNSPSYLPTSPTPEYAPNSPSYCPTSPLISSYSTAPEIPNLTL